MKRSDSVRPAVVCVSALLLSCGEDLADPPPAEGSGSGAGGRSATSAAASGAGGAEVPLGAGGMEIPGAGTAPTGTSPPREDAAAAVPTMPPISGDGGGAPPAGALRVLYRPGDQQTDDPVIQPLFEIVNDGSSPVPLSEVTIRYFYTFDGARPQMYECYDVSELPGRCGSVTGTFVTLPIEERTELADHYFELAFNDGAGELAPGASVGGFNHRFFQSSYQIQYDETDDYSYDERAELADQPKVTAYRRGALVWGQEP